MGWVKIKEDLSLTAVQHIAASWGSIFYLLTIKRSWSLQLAMIHNYSVNYTLLNYLETLIFSLQSDPSKYQNLPNTSFMVKSTCIVAIRSYIPPQQDTSGNFRRQLLTGVSHWRMITQNQSFKELSLSLLSHCLQSPLEKLCWLDVVAPVTLPFWRQGQDD